MSDNIAKFGCNVQARKFSENFWNFHVLPIMQRKIMIILDYFRLDSRHLGFSAPFEITHLDVCVILLTPQLRSWLDRMF